MTRHAAWWLSGVAPASFKAVSFRDARFSMPVVTTSLIDKAADAVLKAQEGYLSKTPATQIIEAIAMTMERWQDKNYPLRKMAEEFLPSITGYSRQMIQTGLPYVLSPFTREGLAGLVQKEFGSAAKLDEEAARRGPKLTLHILAGNIPSVPVESIIRALLMKSASVVKSSSRDPLFPALFAQSLAETDTRLGSSIAALWWKGGEAELERRAFARAEAVIAYGGEAAMAAASNHRQSSQILIEHGPKVSIAAIGREELGRETITMLAHKAAWDVSLFDQQGCVSPHIIFVERGGAAEPGTFAQQVADQMATIESKLPRGRLSIDDATAVQEARSQAEMREAGGEPVELFASPGSTAWTVIFDGGPRTLELSCLNRVVRVVPVDELAILHKQLRPFKSYLQTCGLAIAESRRESVGEMLEETGVTRVCRVGEAQRPPPSWRHDGKGNLTELLRKE